MSEQSDTETTKRLVITVGALVLVAVTLVAISLLVA